jgi:hypothetical protein
MPRRVRGSVAGLWLLDSQMCRMQPETTHLLADDDGPALDLAHLGLKDLKALAGR